MESRTFLSCVRLSGFELNELSSVYDICISGLHGQDFCWQVTLIFILSVDISFLEIQISLQSECRILQLQHAVCPGSRFRNHDIIMEEEGMKLEVKYPENDQLRLSEHITVDINQRSRSPINLDNIQRGYKVSSVDIGRSWRKRLLEMLSWSSKLQDSGSISLVKVGHLQPSSVPGVTL